MFWYLSNTDFCLYNLISKIRGHMFFHILKHWKSSPPPILCFFLVKIECFLSSGCFMQRIWKDKSHVKFVCCFLCWCEGRNFITYSKKSLSLLSGMKISSKVFQSISSVSPGFFQWGANSYFKLKSAIFIVYRIADVTCKITSIHMPPCFSSMRHF